MGVSLPHCTLLVGVDTKTLYSGWWKNASVMLVSNSVVGILTEWKCELYHACMQSCI